MSLILFLNLYFKIIKKYKNYFILLVYKMVYMSGSKSARYSSSLVNRTNNCGGPKKAGLSRSVGWYLPSNPKMIGAVNTQFGMVCMGNFSNASQSALRHVRRGIR
jgi:hypothetical protein